MKIIKQNLAILTTFLCLNALAQTEVDSCTTSVGHSSHGHMFTMLQCDETLTISSNSVRTVSITGNFATSANIIIKPGLSSVKILPPNHDHNGNAGSSTTGRHTKDPKTKIKVPPPTNGFGRGNYQGSDTDDPQEIVLLYPNPASESVNIEAYKSILTISIYNMQGVSIKTLNYSSSTSNLNFNVSDLSSGIYFVKIILKEGEIHNKRMIVD